VVVAPRQTRRSTSSITYLRELGIATFNRPKRLELSTSYRAPARQVLKRDCGKLANEASVGPDLGGELESSSIRSRHGRSLLIDGNWYEPVSSMSWPAGFSSGLAHCPSRDQHADTGRSITDLRVGSSAWQ